MRNYTIYRKELKSYVINTKEESKAFKEGNDLLKVEIEEQKAQQQNESVALTRKAHVLLKAQKWSEAEEVLCRIQKLDPGRDQIKVLLQKTREKRKLNGAA